MNNLLFPRVYIQFGLAVSTSFNKFSLTWVYFKKRKKQNKNLLIKDYLVVITVHLTVISPLHQLLSFTMQHFKALLPKVTVHMRLKLVLGHVRRVLLCAHGTRPV